MSDPMPFSDEITEMYAELHAAERALEAAEAKLAAIDALHHKTLWQGYWCHLCPEPWPCTTHLILHPEEGQ